MISNVDGLLRFRELGQLIVQPVVIYVNEFDETSDIKTAVDESMRESDLILDVLSRHTDHTASFFKDKIKERVNNDWYMTPNECLLYGLVDHVCVPSLTTHVKVGKESKDANIVQRS